MNIDESSLRKLVTGFTTFVAHGFEGRFGQGLDFWVDSLVGTEFRQVPRLLTHVTLSERVDIFFDFATAREEKNNNDENRNFSHSRFEFRSSSLLVLVRKWQA